MGNFSFLLWAISFWFRHWNDFKNRPTFAEVTVKIKVAQFFWLTVYNKVIVHVCIGWIDWVNFQKIMTPEANHVNLLHTSFLGGLKGAESKSAVCPAQRCPIRPQIWKIQDGRHWRPEMHSYIYIFTKHVRKLNTICFYRFSYMRNLKIHVQFWDKMWRNLLGSHI